MTEHEWRARNININRRRKRTHRTVSVKCKHFPKKYESHRKLWERYGGRLLKVSGGFFFSRVTHFMTFLQVIMQNTADSQTGKKQSVKKVWLWILIFLLFYGLCGCLRKLIFVDLCKACWASLDGTSLQVVLYTTHTTHFFSTTCTTRASMN